MPTVQEAVAKYFAAWNEADAGRRKHLLEECWAEKGEYCAPRIRSRLEGREALDQDIGKLLNGDFKGFKVVATTGIDAHHNLFRYQWAVLDKEGSLYSEGTDFGQVDENGQIVQLNEFSGKIPEI